jgi:hypothetical protein
MTPLSNSHANILFAVLRPVLENRLINIRGSRESGSAMNSRLARPRLLPLRRNPPQRGRLRDHTAKPALGLEEHRAEFRAQALTGRISPRERTMAAPTNCRSGRKDKQNAHR